MLGQLSAFPEVPFTEELKRSVDRQLRSAARHVSQEFPLYFDQTIRDMVVAGLERATAAEGTIWLIDPEGETLVPVFNSGPNADQFVGNFRQSLRSGMISMVVATEQPIYENDVHCSRQQDRTLDSRLGVQTTAMIASPVYFAGELRGVLSGVQLRPADSISSEPTGFTFKHLQILQRTVGLLGRLIEHRLMLQALGIEGWV
jgi:hypothetical protein